MNNFVRINAIVLLFFNSISGCFGGLSLILIPDGSFLQMSSEWLQFTPLKDYLIPGIILFIANGLLSLAAAILLIRKTERYPFWLVLQGAVSIGWISGEIILVRMFHWLQLMYGFLGIIFLLSGLFLFIPERKEKVETV